MGAMRVHLPPGRESVKYVDVGPWIGPQRAYCGSDVRLDRGGMADGIGGKETCSTGVQEIYRQTCMHIHIHTHVSDVWLDRGGMADRLV